MIQHLFYFTTGSNFELTCKLDISTILFHNLIVDMIQDQNTAKDNKILLITQKDCKR